MPDKTNDHFIRQRRNLIAISVFLIFFKVSKLDIEEISFLGNKTTIGNPETVFGALIVFFLYFLWRYFTACRSTNGIEHFTQSINNKVDSVIYKKAVKETENKTKLKVEQGFWLDHLAHKRSDDLEKKRYGRYYRIMAVGHELSKLPDINNSIIKHEGLKVLAIYPKATIRMIIQESNFSEYILPYILAALAASEVLGFNVIANTLSFVGEIKTLTK